MVLKSKSASAAASSNKKLTTQKSQDPTTPWLKESHSDAIVQKNESTSTTAEVWVYWCAWRMITFIQSFLEICSAAHKGQRTKTSETWRASKKTAHQHGRGLGVLMCVKNGHLYTALPRVCSAAHKRQRTNASKTWRASQKTEPQQGDVHSTLPLQGLFDTPEPQTAAAGGTPSKIRRIPERRNKSLDQPHQRLWTCLRTGQRKRCLSTAIRNHSVFTCTSTFSSQGCRSLVHFKEAASWPLQTPMLCFPP